MSASDDADLARLANDHWRAAYRPLIDSVDGQWRRFGAIDAFVSPVPIAFANGCLALEPASSADLDAALQWVTAHGGPFRARVDTRFLEPLREVPTALGLERDAWDMPGMVLQPIPAAPPHAPGVTTTRVGRGDYQDFVDVLVAGGLSPDVARSAFSDVLIEMPDVDLFIARLDDRPAGTSVVVRTGAVAGIYTVITIESARRRGVGTAATWAAIERARDWGVSAAVLQASAMGLPIYERMGFRTVVRYAAFVPPDG